VGSFTHINQPIHNSYEKGATDNVSNSYRQQVGNEEIVPSQVWKISRCLLDRGEETRRTVVLDKQRNGDEIHVGDTVLETAATKAAIGGIMAKILSTVLRALKHIQTAMHTKALQQSPRR